MGVPMTTISRVLAAFLIVAPSGCGLQTYSSGVLPMGPDTYSISADDLNASTAKRSALSQAEAHCSSLKKLLLVTNANVAARRARTVYDVTFRCLEPGDPELVRPVYEQAPDVTIEDRRK